MQLSDRSSRVRAQGLAVLAARPAQDPEARELGAALAEFLSAETVPRLRRQLAAQVVRHLDAPQAPEGVIDEVTDLLRRAKTRNERHEALALAGVAAGKGWDLIPVVPALIDHVEAGWARRVLQVLRLIERSSGGVLGTDWKLGYPVSEVVHTLFEQQGSGDIRHECVRLVHEAACRGDRRSRYFLPEAEQAAGDMRMAEHFLQDARACLKALRALQA
jgi:hypothetical protein